MYKNIKAKVTPFGGIHLIHSRLISDKTIEFIDNEIGISGVGAQYKYLDIFLSRIYTDFCGGNATGFKFLIRNYITCLPPGRSA